MSRGIDRTALLQRLETIELDTREQKDTLEQLQGISLAASLLHLAGIEHEREYQLCALVAKHLLGQVPEPEEVDLSE